jgi:hypothetical protein
MSAASAASTSWTTCGFAARSGLIRVSRCVASILREPRGSETGASERRGSRRLSRRATDRPVPIAVARRRRRTGSRMPSVIEAPRIEQRPVFLAGFFSATGDIFQWGRAAESIQTKPQMRACPPRLNRRDDSRSSRAFSSDVLPPRGSPARMTQTMGNAGRRPATSGKPSGKRPATSGNVGAVPRHRPSGVSRETIPSQRRMG